MVSQILTLSTYDGVLVAIIRPPHGKVSVASNTSGSDELRRELVAGRASAIRLRVAVHGERAGGLVEGDTAAAEHVELLEPRRGKLEPRGLQHLGVVALARTVSNEQRLFAAPILHLQKHVLPRPRRDTHARHPVCRTGTARLPEWIGRARDQALLLALRDQPALDEPLRRCIEWLAGGVVEARQLVEQGCGFGAQR